MSAPLSKTFGEQLRDLRVKIEEQERKHSVRIQFTKPPGVAALARLSCMQSMARESHLHFMQYTWQKRRRAMLVGRHTREIAARLDQAIEDYLIGKSTYLVITVPFRHGKSDLVSRYFIPYVLGRLKDIEVILGSYGSSLSEQHSKDAL
ncbi:hypothetical protein BVY04_01385, partial [bacterium M21]